MNGSARNRRSSWIYLLLAIVVIAQIAWVPPHKNVAQAADNGLALKPYMGWSSFSLQVYDGPSGNWISEQKIKATSDAMHEKLQSHGFEYINIDAGWNGSMDEYARPIPSTTLYPNGFENLVDYVHANGQKIGLYFIPGVSPQAVEQDLPIYGAEGCTVGDIVVKPYKYADYWNIGYKIDFSNPCAQKYVDSIADLIASWGVDFVKFDSVTPGSGHNDESIDARDDVKAWSTALSRHGIWLELSWALDHNYVDYWKQYANGWRVNWDVEAYDRNVGMTQWANIARLFPDVALWWRDAGPGGWNDLDSLNVGNGATSGLTRDERQTAATLWAASAAPFYTGDDLTNLDEYGLSLYTNDEVIAVNQAGRPIHPVSTATNQQVWYANNGDGTYTVALFNLGSKGASVGANWSDIGLSGSASVRDLWSHTDLGTFQTGIAPVYLEPHASRLFKVTALGGTSIVNDDDTGMKYSGAWTRNGGNQLVQDSQDLSVSVIDSAYGGSEQPGTEEPASYSVLLNDDFPAIQYANKWGHSTGRPFGDYQGDVHYGEPDNGTEPEFSYTFNGTGIELWSEKSDSSGKIDIFIDGEFKETVDSLGDPQTGQIPVYSITDLSPGEHTIRAVRNPSGQYFFILDALKVTTGSLLGVPSSTEFRKNAPADITVELPLGSSSLTGIKNGTDSLARGSDYSIGGNVVTIPAAYLAQQPSGQATRLTFEFAGGDSQQLSIAVSGTANVGRFAMINNNDPAIRYTGAWNNSGGRSLGDYMDDVHWTENNEAFFTYTFHGTGIDLISEVDAGQGDVEIFLDGVSQGTVSTNDPNASNKPQVTVYSVSGLPKDFHTLKAVKKSGRFMLLDALRVKLPDLIDTSAAEFDLATDKQADVFVNLMDDAGDLIGIYNGSAALAQGVDYTMDGTQVTVKKEYLAAQPTGTTKLTFRFSGDYADDVHGTTEDGSAFQYSFKGTGIELLSPTGPKLGQMDVYVDGELVQTVDAHADSRGALTSLYKVSSLPSGDHTLRVVKKSGEWMLADALRFEVPPAPPVTPGGGGNGGGNSGGGSAVVDTEVKVVRTAMADGTFKQEAKVTDAAAKALIDKQKAAGSSSVALSFPDKDGLTSQTSVSLDAEAVSRLAASGLDLIVEAGGATLRVPSASLQGVSGSLTFTFAPVKSSERKDQIEERANGSGTLKGGQGTMIGVPVDIETNLKDRELILTLPIEAGQNTAGFDSIGVYIEHGDGTKEFKAGEAVASGSGKAVQISVSKFSTFAPIGLEAGTNGRTPYILGTGDGRFLPDKQITRAEIASILARLHDDDASLSSSHSYTDVKSGHWAEKAIAQVTAAGLMNGFADGSFKPDAAINRAEMAAIVLRLSPSEAADGAGFKDMIGIWAEDAIKSAQGAGYLQGYADGTFRPNQTLTRAEAVVILNRVLGIKPLSGEPSPWKDVPDRFWAAGDIAAASSVEAP